MIFRIKNSMYLLLTLIITIFTMPFLVELINYGISLDSYIGNVYLFTSFIFFIIIPVVSIILSFIFISNLIKGY